MHRRIQALARLIVLALSGVACGSSSKSTDTARDSGTTTLDPTWTNVYEHVLVPRCGSCHASPGGPGILTGKLDLSTQDAAYTNLVNAEAKGQSCAQMGTLIVPGEPDSSILYLKVSLDDPSPCGAKMPNDGTELSQTQADLIESWIDNGAAND